MEEIGLFINAVFVMEDLCFMDQDAHIAETQWSLPSYDIFCRFGTNSPSQVRWYVHILQKIPTSRLRGIYKRAA